MTQPITIAVATMDLGITQYKIPAIIQKQEVCLLIVHQITAQYDKFDFEECYQNITNNISNVKIISSNEIGLSKSRNLAIKACTTKYIVFSDDDNDYVEDFSQIIAKYHKQLKEPEFISFQIHDKNGVAFKKYPHILKPHNKMSALRISSIEHIINCDFLKTNNILFDESFGLGALYPSCEQPIFLASILAQGGRAFYVPSPFAIHPIEHSGLDFFSRDNALTRGKMLIRVFGAIKGRLLAAAFIMKKIKSVPAGMRSTFIKGLLDL
ncbi:MAG: glycosyltransferase family 2 protein [Colwellia sp.]|nr:glycosyltransferase family 2 protein [Colwellia sp.]